MNTEMKFSALSQRLRSGSHFLLHPILMSNCLKMHRYVRKASWRKPYPNVWFPFSVLSEIKAFEHNLAVGIMFWLGCGRVHSQLFFT